MKQTGFCWLPLLVVFIVQMLYHTKLCEVEIHRCIHHNVRIDPEKSKAGLRKCLHSSSKQPKGLLTANCSSMFKPKMFWTCGFSLFQKQHFLKKQVPISDSQLIIFLKSATLSPRHERHANRNHRRCTAILNRRQIGDQARDREKEKVAAQPRKPSPTCIGTSLSHWFVNACPQ